MNVTFGNRVFTHVLCGLYDEATNLGQTPNPMTVALVVMPREDTQQRRPWDNRGRGWDWNDAAARIRFWPPPGARREAWDKFSLSLQEEPAL